MAHGEDIPANIWIAGARSWVLAGRNLPLQASAFGEFGETLYGIRFQWSSSNPSVAAVTEGGTVVGLLPGRAIIEAAGGGVAGQFVVWVHPARIEITPGRVDLEIGARAELSARALDADGKPLSGSVFSWISSRPGVARIDAGGSLEAVGAGSITITARLNVPDGGLGFSGQAQAIVRPRPPFRSERLISSDYSAAGAITIKAVRHLDYVNDRLVLNASLSNGGQAVVLYHQNGQVRKLIATGDLVGTVTVREISGVAINSRGDVAASLYFQNAPDGVLLFPFDKPESPYLEPQTPGRCCMAISPGGLTDNGEFVFGNWNNGADELRVSRAGGPAVQLPTDSLPGFGRGIWMRDRARMAGPGRVLFGAGAPNVNAAFLWDGRQMVKLAGQNETVAGFRANGYNSVIPGSSGDVYGLFWGQGCIVARWAGGTWTKVLECGQQFGGTRLDWIHWVAAARDDAVLFEANSSGANSLFRYAGGQLQRLLTWSDRGFQWMRWGFLRPDGDAVVVGPWPGSHTRVSRVGTASEAPIFETGRNVDFPAPFSVNWTGLGGAGTGGTLITRTASGAVARLAPGTGQILLSPGDVLADGSIIDWVGNGAAAPNGDYLVTAGSTRGDRLFLLRGQTRIEVHGPANRIQTTPGEEVNGFPSDVAINSRGQIVAQVRIRIPTNGLQLDRVIQFSETNRQARTVYSPGSPSPGGGTFGWLGNAVLDDQGRLWFQSNTDLYQWDNGALRRLHSMSEPLPDGRRVQTYNDLQVANGKLYFWSWFPNSPAALMETDGASVRYTITHNQVTSFGAQIGWFPNSGQFRVAPNGAIAYLAFLNGQSQTVLVRKPDGTDVVVARQNERAGGAWIESPLDLAWDIDGRLFYTAATIGAVNRNDLFLATPQ
jgi:hypothetical protein